jgi:tetratricopeptide (TPR) repeat protein
MMRTKLLSLFALSLLAPALALAQAPPAGNAKAGKRPQMYEDIEIMRQLLNQKLYKAAPVTPLGNFNNNFYMTQPNQFGTYSGGGLTPHVLGGLNAAPQPAFRMAGPNSNFGLATSAAPASEAEGVYLKGQGVVFTITVAPSAHDPRPAPEKPAAKAASDWDRTRSEVRGEKVPPPKTTETKSASVADTILKLLADNGHHFSQLGAEESLIVVVTFRGGVGGQAKTGKEELIRRAYLDLTGTLPTPEAVRAFLQDDREDAYQKLVEGLLSETQPRTTAPATNDHEVLGDLHMKQGKAKEAIEAYQKAMEKEPKRDVILNKLIQANVAANNYTKAQELLKNAKDLAKQPTLVSPESAKPPTPATASAPALPAKLLISAPKKLLDLAGGGKISFDEFKKAATVEYLTFSPAAAEKK